MGTRGEIHTYIHTNKFLTRPTCQFASVDINFDDFFTFSAVTNTVTVIRIVLRVLGS